MKKFVFRLESLLKYRQVTLREAEHQLTLQNQKYALVANAIEHCQEEQRKMLMLYGTKKGSIQDRRRAELYCQGLQFRIDEKKKELKVVEKERALAQAAYVEKKKYHRVIELLKEKAWQEYKMEKARYVEKMLDDILLAHENAEKEE